jgi:excisionase family DNA binding protein
MVRAKGLSVSQTTSAPKRKPPDKPRRGSGPRYQEVPTERRLLTTSQVCDRLVIDPRTLRRWVRRGKLHVIKLSDRGNRYKPEEVERLIQARTV